MNFPTTELMLSELARAKADLRDLVKLESVSAQGRMLKETSDAVVQLLEAEGFVVRSYPGQVAPVLVAETPLVSGRTLLIYNHYDVQPETPIELWDSPPFEMTERKDDAGALRWYGRGVSDDKGEFIVRLAAVRALRQSNAGQLPLNIKWLLEGEEEVGSPSLEKFVEEHAQELKADVCWWEFGSVDPSGKPILTFGLKGVVCLELRCKVADSDLHSSLGAVVDNPLWRISKAIASLRDETGRVSIPGFFDDVQPVSSTDQAALASIPDESAAMQSTYGITKFFADAIGQQYYHRLAFEPCVNVNGIHGGYGEAGHKTVLPAEAFAKLDFRLVPNQDPAKVLVLLRQHLDAQGLQDIEVIELESSQRAARSNLDDPFAQAAIAAAREVYGMEPVIHPSSGASGPMHPFIEHIGLPVVSVGIANVGSRIHAPNENIVAEDFERGLHYAVVFLGKLAQM